MTPTARLPSPRTLLIRARQVSIGRRVTVAALLLITIQIILRGYWVSQSWFYSDDLLFLGDIGHHDDDLAWYFRFHFSHFMPLSFVLVKIVTLVGAYSWAAAAVQIVTMQLLASLAAWWMLRTVFGNRPAILVPLIFYLFSAMTIPSVMWWAVAINQLPHQIAVFGAIGGHTLYLRHHRARHLALTAFFLLIGYSTYTKTMLLPIVLVLMTLMYFADGDLMHRLKTTLKRDWLAWLVHGAMLTAYVVAYVARQPPGAPVDFKGDPIGLGFDTMALGFIPGLTGGPLEWVTWTSPVTVVLPSELLIITSWILVIAAVSYLALTRTRVLRSLLIPAIYLAISIGLIYVGRFYVIDFLGTFYISRHMQYLADTAAIVTLTIGLMCLPIPGSVESSEPRVRPLLTIRPHRVAVALLGALVVAGYIVSSSRYAAPWNTPFAQRDFYERAIEALDKERPVLADTAIPAVGISPYLFPNNMPAIAFSPVSNTYSVRRLGNDLQVFRDDATLASARVDGPVRTSKDPAFVCAYRAEGGSTKIPFVPVANYPLWMGIRYIADREGSVPLVFGTQRVMVPIEKGMHTLFIATAAAYDSIELWAQPGQEICVSSVRVGELAPEEGS